MILKKEVCCFFLLASFIGYAQKSYTIKGHFPQVKNTELELIGFKTLKDTLLAKTQSDSLGNFNFSYPEKYVGAAVLKINSNNSQKPDSFIVLLNKESFAVSWSDLEDFKTLHFDYSRENNDLSNGMEAVQDSEAILAGLKYLKPLYQKSPKEVKWLQDKIAIQENTLPNFIKKVPVGNYAGYYLTIRKLIADMPATANRYPERMPEHEKQFNAIDFSDERLLHSGLLTLLIDGYYQLIESYIDPDAVAAHANASTDALLKSLNGDPALKQETAFYLFQQLEKRSMFKAAEHVALLMLNDAGCVLDKKATGLYEQYRKMAVGQQAPVLELTNTGKEIKTLADVSGKFKLVVFGSSWCTKCQEEVAQLKTQYQNWKDQYNLEIVFVSLDTQKEQYEAFVNDFPWISSVDYKGWESKGATDYYVFATPTMYLLDSDQKIILKPVSSEHVNSWLISNGGN